MDGHGTHTASTAAGRQVSDVAALGGFAKGTASGGAPLARLAIYKACWAIPNQSKADGNTCLAEDMLAAMDDAIADGVDILSVSIVTAEPLPYHQDTIGLGALHAAKHNILVVCSAGNNGPAPGTLSNPAPWLITVGASSLDRAFFAPVILGNGLEIIVRHDQIIYYNYDFVFAFAFAFVFMLTVLLSSFCLIHINILVHDLIL